MLDEATFQQLLAAAFVLQQQQREEERHVFPIAPPLPRVTKAEPDPAGMLSVIAETQRQLLGHLTDLPGAAKLVANCLRKVTHATGVGIALVRKDQLEYCAAVGSLSPFVGSRIAMTEDFLSSMPALSSELSQHEAAALIASAMETNTFTLPLHHEGKVAGLLEAQFEDGDVILEQDVRTCQLLAGLMTQTIARAAELQWKNALAAERATMIEVLERIRPQLERLAGKPQTVVPQEPVPEIVAEAAPEIVEPEPIPEAPVEEQELPQTLEIAPVPAEDRCLHCGYKFATGELFCGRCGTARTSGGASGDLQSKWASLWHMQQAGTEDAERSGEVPAEQEFDFTQEPVHDLEANTDIRIIDIPELTVDGAPEFGLAGNEEIVPPAVSKPPVPWKSSAQTRKWLESVQPNSPARLWIARNRGNLYVGVALLVLLVVASGLGTHASAPRAGSNQQSLSLFEQLMVGVGLAEPPTNPTYVGNPNTQVWVDLHTALYYCPGSDLYGKTPNGKYTTQRDAQLDQFEPAARKSCD